MLSFVTGGIFWFVLAALTYYPLRFFFGCVTNMTPVRLAFWSALFTSALGLGWILWYSCISGLGPWLAALLFALCAGPYNLGVGCSVLLDRRCTARRLARRQVSSQRCSECGFLDSPSYMVGGVCAVCREGVL